MNKSSNKPAEKQSRRKHDHRAKNKPSDKPSSSASGESFGRISEKKDRNNEKTDKNSGIKNNLKKQEATLKIEKDNSKRRPASKSVRNKTHKSVNNTERKSARNAVSNIPRKTEENLTKSTHNIARNQGNSQGNSEHAAELVTVEIVDLTHEGEGVGRLDGYTLFIRHALPGDHVRARITKRKKQYGYAELVEIIKPSADRIDAPCTVFEQCGGCQMQHLDYEAQLKWKKEHVIHTLSRLGRLDVAERGIVKDTIGMDEPWRYRNKAAVPIGRDSRTGQLVAGFYSRGSHDIVDIADCLIQDQANDEALAVVKDIAQKLGVSPYNEQTGTGLLRHTVIRTGFVSNEMMIVLITNGTKLPHQEEWIAQIRKRLPNVKSIVQNINNKNTNVIFGDQTITLWGEDVIYDELDGVRFAISARSFYQVNPKQTVELYRKAVDYAGLSGSETVIDAYCGIGTISLFLARYAKKVYGVEIVPEAIEDAKKNAELNGLTNAEFEAGPAEVVIPRWRQEGIEADVIVVDPPRKGCDQALLDTIIAMKPERVVYVSCNPSTLARDLRVLEDGGFKTVEVTPVDMFPHTTHVECCSLLVRKDY